MIINDLPLIMIKCLICTIIIELVIVLVIGIRNKFNIINVILVNILTNPLVVSIPVYFNIKYGLFTRNVVLIILEILIFVIEALIYKKYLKYKKINPYLISLILNLGSYLFGLIINNI